MKPTSPVVTTTNKPSRPTSQTTTFTQPKVSRGNYAEQPKLEPKSTIFDIQYGDKTQQVKIPNAVKDIFLNEALASAENAAMTVNDVANTGMLLFGGYIEAATHYVESHGGGGSSPSSDWGKKDDDDDWKFARRCLQMAHSMSKPETCQRTFHR